MCPSAAREAVAATLHTDPLHSYLSLTATRKSSFVVLTEVCNFRHVYLKYTLCCLLFQSDHTSPFLCTDNLRCEITEVAALCCVRVCVLCLMGIQGLEQHRSSQPSHSLFPGKDKLCQSGKANVKAAGELKHLKNAH